MAKDKKKPEKKNYHVKKKERKKRGNNQEDKRHPELAKKDAHRTASMMKITSRPKEKTIKRKKNWGKGQEEILPNNETTA